MIRLSGYQLTEKIYEGRNSIIYRGIQNSDDKPVVVKFLNKEKSSREDLAQFSKEYNIAKNLTGEGIIDVYRLEKHSSNPAIIMEDINGESVEKIFYHLKMNLEEFISLAIKMADILGQVHQQNIIHKDINPSNFIFNQETRQLKLIDFGIATELPREIAAIKNPNIIEGTLAYISPEQTGRINRSMDYRTDFYSLGITFYRMLTGSLPHQSDNLLELVHSHIAIQPISPHEMDRHIPQVISDIIMKLMSKNAEDRYLSAFGLKSDLEKCKNQLKDSKIIQLFDIGENDYSNKLQIPEKLYGRQKDVSILIEAFERIGQGKTELMLVSGNSGIGKSVLINEIHKPVVMHNGLFVSGKFEQLNKEVPYSAIIQAFIVLAKQILAEDESEIAKWKENILSAVKPNGKIITEIIPLFELIIGKQADLPKLGAMESQNRFNRVFQAFMKVMAGKDHPLVVFLDDLQWADLASLQLLKLFLTDKDITHLFIIGAYRPDETLDSHPLILTLNEIKKVNATSHTISLSPLAGDHINELLVDTFKRASDTTENLAELLVKKTNGNPFFINEFLKTLYKENLIVFSFEDGWAWDFVEIEKMQATNNVIELVTKKITDLPKKSQEALKLGACLGSYFDLDTLVKISGKSEQEMLSALSVTLVEGMLNRIDDIYKFSHDRVQETVYSLIPDNEKIRLHYYIGNLELKKADNKELLKKLFYIVNHLNAGIELVTEKSEKLHIVELNLIAGKKAMASNAYDSSLAYLNTGIGLIEEDGWQTRYDLTLALYQEAAAAAQLSADYETMEKRVQALFKHGKTTLDKVKGYEARISACNARNQLIEAIRIGLDALSQLGIRLPEKPGKLRIAYELLQVKLVLKGRSVKGLVHLPKMENPQKLAIMKIFSRIATPAYFAAPELLPLIVFKSVGLSVKYGNSVYSPYFYTVFGMIHCGVLGDINTGYAYGELALRLVEKFYYKEIKAKVLFIVWANLTHWKRSKRDSVEQMLEAYKTGLETGDLEFAALSAFSYSNYLFYCGVELAEVEKETAKYTEIIRKLNQDTVINYHLMLHQVILNLQGISNNPCKITGESYDENKMLPLHEKANDRNALFNFYFHSLTLNYLFDDYEQALQYAEQVKPFCNSQISHPYVQTINFYDSLIRLSLYPIKEKPIQNSFLKQVKRNQKKMKKWAGHAPMNYKHEYHLVEAEVARIRKMGIKAANHYNCAIGLAQENEFIHEEALAYELYAKFLDEKGEKDFAAFTMAKAHHCYKKWGVNAKVTHLEARYPYLRILSQQTSGSVKNKDTVTIKSTGQTLDMLTVTKATQALSSIIELESLLEKMIRLIMENAGAEKGFVILNRNDKLLIEASADINLSDIRILKSIPLDACEYLSKNIVKYVLRTNNNIVLPNEKDITLFANDPYISKNNPKSVLCIPMRHMDKTTGALYLENNITENAFTKERIEILTILLSQAVISLENAYLYNNLDKLVKDRTAELEAAQAELIENAHKAGMADIATGILHNIGNILNSIKTSTYYIKEHHRWLFVDNLSKANTMLIENFDHIDDFILNDPKGKKLLQYYIKIGEMADESTSEIKTHIDRLSNKIDLIAGVVSAQQQYAGTASLTEKSLLSDIIEDALKMQQESLADYHISIEKTFHETKEVTIQKIKLIHLITNLINNAKEAMERTPEEKRKLIFSVYSENQKAYLTVQDTGIGIPAENLIEIFRHGFSTKEGGAGFGLHSCANYMTEMKGKIWADSEGKGKGAKFTLEFPI